MNEEPQSHKSSTSRLNSSGPGNWTDDKNELKVSFSVVVLLILLNLINFLSLQERKKFSWNQSEEGLLLSAVFWLLWLSHPVGGTLSHKFGAKIVTAVSVFLASCLCLFLPSASFIHMKLLLVVRVIQGFILVSFQSSRYFRKQFCCSIVATLSFLGSCLIQLNKFQNQIHHVSLHYFSKYTTCI